MAAFLNTEYKGYAVAGTIPVVQQVVGLTALLKNLIGVVKDVAQAVFSCSSFTEVNERLDVQLLAKSNNIDALKLLEKTHQNVQKVLSNLLIRFEDNQLNGCIQTLKNQQTELNLEPLAPKIQDIIDRFHPAHSLKGRYENLCYTVEQQIKNKISDLKWECDKLEIQKCQPGLERLHNIAIAILTFIPVVGTIYNGISLQYFPQDDLVS